MGCVQVGDQEGAACEPWPLDPTCLPDDWTADPAGWTPEQARAVTLASELMWRATAGRYGTCLETVRPCDPRHTGGGQHDGAPPPPVPLQIDWQPALSSPLTVQLAATGVHDAAILDFGDGSPTRVVVNGQWVTHTYPRAGVYTATVVDNDNGQRAAYTNVTVKTQLHQVAVFASGMDDWIALLWVNEPNDDTPYRIDWGDGTSEDFRKKQPPLPRRPHQYHETGTYPIVTTDLATRRDVTCLLDVGQVGMLWTFPTSVYRPRLTVAWLRVGAQWTLDWGDSAPPETGEVPTSGSLHLLHPTTMNTGTYTATLTETVDGQPRRIAQRVITIPSTFNLSLDVWTTWEPDPDRPGRQLVHVTPRDPDAGVCTVTWGDGSPDGTVNAGETVTHSYALPVPPEGLLLTVQDSTVPPRVFQRRLAEPTYVGAANLNARTTGAVDIHVAGVNNLLNQDWYSIDWGDGSSEALGAVGAWWPAYHVYTTEGPYTITVDSPGMPHPIKRIVDVVIYPAPTVTTTEDISDTTRMTTLVTVDNTACGGPAVVDFDDGDTTSLPETGTVPHQYRQPGSFTIVAACQADPTARGRAHITVPYGPEHSLQVHVGQHDPADAWTAEARLISYNLAKTITVFWGNGTSSPIGSQPVTHTYSETGTWTVVASYDDGSESTQADVTIPFPEQQ